MANNEFTIPIPARLKNVAKGGHVAGADQIIDDTLGKEQSVINQEVSEAIEGNTEAVAAERQRAEAAEGALDNRLSDVEELAEISIDGGEAKIATGEDFHNPTAEQRVKIPTVGAILDGVDDEPTAGSQNLVKSGGIADAYGSYVPSNEFKSVETDSEGRILNAIDVDDVSKHFLKEEFNNDVEFKKKLKGSQIEDKNNYVAESNEFSDVVIDSDERLLEERINDGRGTKKFNTPVIFTKNVSFKGGIDIDTEGGNVLNKKSAKYTAPSKPLHNVFGSHQNIRDWTSPYNENVSNIFDYTNIRYTRISGSYQASGSNVVDISMINSLKEKHIKVLASLDNLGYKEDESDSTIIAKITEAVTLYGNVIDCWEAFNEPDLNFVFEEGALETYFHKQKVVYNTFKSLQPNSIVLVGAFQSINSLLFSELANLRDSDGKAFWDYTDAIDFHHYMNNYVGLESTMKNYKGLCDQVYNKEDYSHLKDKRIWITEFSTIPLTDENKDSERHKIIPKQALTYLSYGTEKIFLYKLWSYNYFVVTPRDNYYGIVTPRFNCAYAGFTYADEDKTSLTADKLLDKTYIWPSGVPNNRVPFIPLDLLSKADITTKGIAINGNGFSINEVYVAKRTSVLAFEKIRTVWTGNVTMTGDNYIIIDNDIFEENDFDKDYCLVTSITNITMTDTSLNHVEYSDTYHAIKFLESLLINIEDCPNVVTDTGYTIVSWKLTNGLYNCAIWGNLEGVTINVSDNATFYDVKGNILANTPTNISDSPIYITNISKLQIIK